jgi:hypothetical protein
MPHLTPIQTARAIAKLEENSQSDKIEANSSVDVSSTSSYFFFHTKQRKLSPN